MKAKIISLICASFLSLSCAHADPSQTPTTSQTTNTNTTPVLYSQMSNSASVKLNKDQQSAILTLNQVNNKTTWFTDRPMRQGGVMSTAKFISEWHAGGKNSFQVDPPNANMVALNDSHAYSDPESLGSFALSNPIYNPKKHTLSYTITSTSDQGQLHNIKKINDVVLFIDSSILGCTPSGNDC